MTPNKKSTIRENLKLKCMESRGNGNNTRVPYDRENKKKRVGLKKRMMITSLSLVVAAILIVGSLCVIQVYNDSVDKAFTSVKNVTDTARVAIEQNIEFKKDLVEEVGILAYENFIEHGEATFKSYLREKAVNIGAKDLYIIGNTGKVYGTQDNMDVLATESFYTAAMRGESTVTSPRVLDNKKETEMFIVSPLWDQNKVGTMPIGAVVAVYDGKWMSEMVGQMHIGTTGVLYLLDSDGYTIASTNYDNVLRRENARDDVKSDPSLQGAVDIENQALNGRVATGKVDINGTNMFFYALPLDIGGWCLGAYATSSEHLESTYNLMLTCLCMCFVVSIGAAALVARFVNSIVNPLSHIQSATMQMANGSYDVFIQYGRNDEIGDVIENLQYMVRHNRDVIRDTGRCLELIASGDFTAEPEDIYVGEFVEIRRSIDIIANKMSSVINTIKHLSENVKMGSSQVSDAAQSLSQGATQQSASVEELAASISMVSKHTGDTARNAAQVKDIAQVVHSAVNESDEYMGQLEGAMNQIMETSNNINNIIKSIDDIAFQTSILALNAAVEAARAGEAGKGFTVVADEVRNLAQKSADSAKDTSQLISEALSAVRKGKELTGKTASALRDVVEKIETVSNSIIEITEATDIQADELNQISIGIDQVATVVQSNSATAEQSAAASITMAGVAVSLNDAVKDFITKENTLNVGANDIMGQMTSQLLMNTLGKQVAQNTGKTAQKSATHSVHGVVVEDVESGDLMNKTKY